MKFPRLVNKILNVSCFFYESGYVLSTCFADSSLFFWWARTLLYKTGTNLEVFDSNFESNHYPASKNFFVWKKGQWVWYMVQALKKFQKLWVWRNCVCVILCLTVSMEMYARTLLITLNLWKIRHETTGNSFVFQLLGLNRQEKAFISTELRLLTICQWNLREIESRSQFRSKLNEYWKN